MLARLLVLGLLALPTGVRGVTLQAGSEEIDTLELACGLGPPAIEIHPFDPDVAFVACTTEVPGASSITIAPGLALGFQGVDYFLPGNLNCSESLANCGEPTGFNFGTVGNLFLDPLGSMLARGWLTTSNCELVVPFNTVTGSGIDLLYQGESRRSVPTKRCISGSFSTYTSSGPGGSISGFATNLTGSVLRVGARLLVATSNIETTNPPVMNPGTVLLFDIDDSGPTPSVSPATPPFIVTSDPNPTALTELPGGLVAVTNTGVLDVRFPPLVTGAGSIDIIDPSASAVLGSIPLGQGNPGGRTLAIDPNGTVAIATSHTKRVLFAVDIRGLASLPRASVDPTLQRRSCNDVEGESADGVPCLRDRVIHDFDNPIELPPPPGVNGTAGFVVEVRFGASGDFLSATSFNDGGLSVLAFDPRHLGRPHPLLPSRFGPPETLAATAPAGQFGLECCPGPMMLHGNSAGGVSGTDVIWLTFAPDGIVSRGTLQGTLAPATGDTDADGVEDALDVCPAHASASQADADDDGIGDACDCGDLDGSLKVDEQDSLALRRWLADPSAVPASPADCNLAGELPPGVCDILDGVVLERARGGRSSSAQTCFPALL